MQSSATLVAANKENELKSASFDYVTDIVIVGAGCAGLVGALAAKESGKNVLVVESTPFVGVLQLYPVGAFGFQIIPS